MTDEDQMKNEISTITFQLTGLSCSCEANMIEKRMKSLTGVKTYAINPVSNKIKVSFDPNQVGIQEIIKSIAKTGIKASVLDNKK